jgi:DNA polymerase III delta prime subunit
MYPRLKAICDQEGFKLDEITLKKIIESTNGDMRQCLNLLMLWSVDGQSINPSNVKDL